MNTMIEERTTTRLELNGPAPDFEAQTTMGPLRLSDWAKDKWVILFSHPADFTPVCTTEFIEFAKRYDEFEKKNVALLGCSVDSVYSHIAWARNIQEKFGVAVRFPVIADIDTKISRLYGMIHESSTSTATVRCVFFIDPKRIIRAMIYYPLNVGRNFDEIMRVVNALQMADENKVACPANWMPGEDVIVPAPTTMEEAEVRAANSEYEVKDWYFARKKVA
ncbi:Mitochondrial peroxiredoxin PRX1, putative [Ricinus communis]|uniref:Peroxiredoxin n=1 Tax=Ricinus communis TaxID=3988 RepID=B9TDU3_RICCO|nr:Mitochondrial peroxiredoxin PRX1, putative [Ricinus communis]